LSDDGSTDDTVEVVRGFDDARVHLLSLPRNAGASCARNRGIGAARAAVVGFLDSDDEWRPRVLARQLAPRASGHDASATVAYWYAATAPVESAARMVYPEGDVLRCADRRVDAQDILLPRRAPGPPGCGRVRRGAAGVA
jgi:glycosyltransferase involved in cell wall biosynthesis